MSEEQVEIETDFCEHCNEAIERVPYERDAGSVAGGTWVWRWEHHNSGSVACNCSGEHARPPGETPGRQR